MWESDDLSAPLLDPGPHLRPNDCGDDPAGTVDSGNNHATDVSGLTRARVKSEGGGEILTPTF